MIGFIYGLLILGFFHSGFFCGYSLYQVANGVEEWPVHLSTCIFQAAFFTYFAYHLFYGFPKWIKKRQNG